MENRIELSLRDLEIVNGGGETVNIMGDTWTCDGKGNCTRTQKEDTLVNRIIKAIWG